jgi:hypothetical protein
MNQKGLSRLRQLLEDKYWEVAEQTSFEDTSRSLWLEKCELLGIKKADEKVDFPGQIFEETVLVIDPCPSGTWLEMTKETAEKILAIGFP